MVIKFSEGYEQAINNGTKKITIRKGIIRELFPGQIENTNIGPRIKIKSVRYTYFGELSDIEIKDDGFNDINDCLHTMNKFYSQVILFDLCTVIRFEKVS